jgi:dipeptidase D
MFSSVRARWVCMLALALFCFSSAVGAKPRSTQWIPANASSELAQMLKDFSELTGIYRKSGSESGVRDFILNIAFDNGIREYEVDPSGNLKIFVPGTGEFYSWGRERSIALQSHMDMVLDLENETSALAQEGFFKSEGIELVNDNGWVHSANHQTSIGADNGIGVISMIRYLRRTDIPHPPLDLIFTSYEEAGFVGAKGLVIPSRVRALVNLDGGVYGTATLGGHGYRRLGMKYALKADRLGVDQQLVKIEFKGLHGGHSGLNGHDGYANSVNLLARWLVFLSLDSGIRNTGVRVVALDAGDSAYNKIPNFFSVTLALKSEQAARVQSLLDAFGHQVQTEYASKEYGISWKIQAPTPPISGVERGVLLSAIASISDRVAKTPFGVITSEEYPASADLNSNMSFLHLNPGKDFRSRELTVGIMPRFLVDDIGARFNDQMRKHFEAVPGFKASVFYEESGPAWNPGKESELARLYSLSLGRVDPTTEMKTEVSLGGLEPGQFAEKYPHLPMIAVAQANIHDEHSRMESFEIESLEKSVKVLDAYLYDLGASERSWAFGTDQ